MRRDATGTCDLANLHRILGRTSVDILKSGGYKISALEVPSCVISQSSEARKQSKNTLLDIFERYIEGYHNLYNTF